MDKHNQLREILGKYNCPEIGDAIIDEISRLFGYPDTIAASQDDFIRVAALNHEALGTSAVKVIFRDGGHDKQGGAEAAYFMDRETYRQIPLGDTATLADYKKIGTVAEAQNLDIYSNL